MLVRSFTVNIISGTRHQPLLHAIHNLFMFVEYCHLLELYVKCAALYRTFIPQSFWNTRCGRPRGRKWHLTRSLVASKGWSLVKDRTNRKHCPSHEIWSYKRDGRWWWWSFDRGSTVLYYLDERSIHPAYKISCLNNKTAKLSEDRHPITQNESFPGGHLGLRQYGVTAREFRWSYPIPVSI